MLKLWQSTDCVTTPYVVDVPRAELHKVDAVETIHYGPLQTILRRLDNKETIEAISETTCLHESAINNISKLYKIGRLKKH